jgi:acyl-CoA thioester hydrolase
MSCAPPPIHPIDAPQNAESIAPSIAFWCSLTVPEHSSTIDEIPHVNNAEYVRWIDRTAELATDAVGLTRQMLLEAKRMWFVARHEIDYRGESFVGDELLIATWISDYSRISALRRTVVYRPADQKIILDATTRWVYVNLETRKPTRMEQDVIDRFPVAAPENKAQ